MRDEGRGRFEIDVHQVSMDRIFVGESERFVINLPPQTQSHEAGTR
jgi:hypothetical protein